MASCADRLHQIQQDAGISDRDLKRAVREMATPTKVKLPTFHEKLSEEDRMVVEAAAPPTKKQRRYQVAYWYLEEYLKPEYAQAIYMKYTNFKELVEYAYNEGIAVIQIMTFMVEEDVDPMTIFPEAPDDDLDIPTIQWKEFDEYCKKHPLNNAGDILRRREKFRKHRHKRRGKYYKRRAMRMYDPLFAATVVDEKEILKNLKRISAENEQRVKKFQEMLHELIPDTAKGSELMSRFNRQTKEIMKTNERRMHEFMKRIDQKPSPIEFYID